MRATKSCSHPSTASFGECKRYMVAETSKARWLAGSLAISIGCHSSSMASSTRLWLLGLLKHFESSMQRTREKQRGQPVDIASLLRYLPPIASRWRPSKGRVREQIETRWQCLCKFAFSEASHHFTKIKESSASHVAKASYWQHLFAFICTFCDAKTWRRPVTCRV